MPNPVLVEVFRGVIVESGHRGAFAVVGPGGALVASAGDIETPVYPRSAIKALQALPLLETGAADSFGLEDTEIALTCASHGGEEAHVSTARAILAKLGALEDQLECGAHPPTNCEAHRSLIRSGEKPSAIHNNCSGKHAGMLALAAKLGADPKHYACQDHPVQRRVANLLDEICSIRTTTLPVGIDGCSVPTWAIPLRNLALGFQRFASGEGFDDNRRRAAERIIAAARSHPFMIAGSGRFCTRLMQAVPRAFVKTGAEGVFCAAVPHAGLGIALKCDDGAHRASQTAIASVLANLSVWTPEEEQQLRAFTEITLQNWRKLDVGRVSTVNPLPVTVQPSGHSPVWR